MSMNPEIKEKWIKALRSGEYKKGKGQLCNPSDNTFCCLGVLTDLYLKKTAKEWGRTSEILPEYGYLHEQVKEWSGLKSTNPSVVSDEGRKDLKVMFLTMLNDSTDLSSFDLIADLIEASSL